MLSDKRAMVFAANAIGPKEVGRIYAQLRIVHGKAFTSPSGTRTTAFGSPAIRIG